MFNHLKLNYHKHKNSALCSQNVFVFRVILAVLKVNVILQYSFNRLVFLAEAYSVLCKIQKEYKIRINYGLRSFENKI
jgi:hypothetical protein